MSSSSPPKPPPRPPPTPKCNTILQTTAITAIATATSQFFSNPIDVATRLCKATATRPTPPALLSALRSTVQTSGPLALFSGLPLQCLKRLPTKTLTVALFQLATQSKPALTLRQQIPIAISAGLTALIATYPIHVSYHALRKGASLATISRSIRQNPPIVYSGAIPALCSTAPTVLLDYMLYKSLRRHIDSHQDPSRPQPWSTAAIIAAAIASNLAAGFFAEPFKAVSRRMAVESLQSASCGSLVGTARGMWRAGVGEFWKGFPVRCLRYAISAVVSKTTVQGLQRARRVRPVASTERARFAFADTAFNKKINFVAGM